MMRSVGGARGGIAAAVVFGMVILGACAPGASDGGSSTTTAPAAATVPTITGATYAQSSVRLTFAPPADTNGHSVTDYLYDVSCDGGATVFADHRYLGTSASPAFAGTTCADGQSSSYRLSAVLDGTTTSPPSAWRTTDALVAPTLTAAVVHAPAARLTFSPPPVAPTQTVTNYRYDLSCDGGATVQSAGWYVGTTASPADVGIGCVGSPSTYRLAAVVDSTWTSPSTAWLTAT